VKVFQAPVGRMEKPWRSNSLMHLVIH
jgi:hypothetical protein